MNHSLEVVRHPIMLAIAVSVFLAIILAGMGLRKRQLLAPLPPGPPGYPLIGNALDKAGPFDWRQFSERRSKWGDITSVTALGRTTVTLHTYEKAVELLDKKSAIHSSRPIMQFFDIGGWSNIVQFLPDGRQLRKCRKMVTQELTTVKMGEFNSHQEFTIKRFLRALLRSPDQFYDRVEWYTSSIILKIVYGYDTLDEDDPMVKHVNDALSFVADGSAPGQILEVLPWLRYLPSWVPGTRYNLRARQSRVFVDNVVEEPFKYALQRMDEGIGESNFVTKRLPKAISSEELQWLKDSAFSFIFAGIETTSTVLQTFFFLLQEYPSVQKEAQDEVDRVIAHGRLPSFNDRADLPYVHALYKEILRFNVPGPGGLPHESVAVDVHDGYYLPKGTVIVPSIWEMSRDPTVYTDPNTFNPSRFLGSQPERDPVLYVFGFGRRACPGINVAEQTIFLTMSTVLATFDVSAFDSKNKEEMRFPEGFLNHPLPFKCHITPRPGVNVEELTA